MSEGENPFTEYVTKAKRGEGNSRTAWIVAGVLGALLIAALLLWASALGRLHGVAALRSNLDDANTNLASATLLKVDVLETWTSANGRQRQRQLSTIVGIGNVGQ